MHKFSPQEQQQVAIKALEYANSNPPVIGVVGLSGVGKSSTLNAMFGTTLQISHTVACTKVLSEAEFELDVKTGLVAGEKVKIKVVDAPGLGESILSDPEYLRMYENHLAACDIVLWIFSANNRALALDQTYLQRFKPYFHKMVFAVNQVDAIIANGWNERINLPKNSTKILISEIISDRQEKIFEAIAQKTTVIEFSAERGYRLQKLFRALIEKLPEDRRWLFDSLRIFSFRDFFPGEGRKWQR